MAKCIVILAAVILGALGFPKIHNKSSYNGRIVGGKDAPDGSFPYMVSLRYPSNSHLCGASIIDAYTMLTAAHCLVGQNPSSIIAVVGTHKLSQGGDTYKVRELKSHSSSDTGLVILESPIKFSNKVSTIDLETEHIDERRDCVISGWGYTSHPGFAPDHLQYINLKTITNKECGVGDDEICTFTKEGEGTCSGDSGGPLVANGRQIGIVSGGVPCALGYPDGYARVSHVIDWINENRGTRHN